MKNSLLYQSFKANAEKTSETEFINIYKLELDGVTYNIYQTKRRANKHSYLMCNDECILWQQNPFFPLLSGSMMGIAANTVKTIFKFSNVAKGNVNIFVIKGRPGMIKGLDSGYFLSYRKRKQGKYLYVMTKRRFKKFSL